LNNTYPESFYRNKQASRPPKTELASSNISNLRESSPESKLIRDWEFLTMERRKTLPRDLRHLQLWLANSMLWAADLPNGEQCLRLGMDALPTSPYIRMLKDWLNMQQFVKRMDSFPLSSLRFYLTVLTLPKTVKELLKRYLMPSSMPFTSTKYYLKAVS